MYIYCLPVQIILHILGQVYVEQNKIMHVAPGERSLCFPGIQLAVPFLNTQYCIMDNFWGGFDVLEDALQRHIFAGTSRLQGLAAKHDHTNKVYYIYITYTAYICVCVYAEDQFH